MKKKKKRKNGKEMWGLKRFRLSGLAFFLRGSLISTAKPPILTLGPAQISQTNHTFNQSWNPDLA